VRQIFSIEEGHHLILSGERGDQAPPTINVAVFDGATVHRLDQESSITHVHGLVTGHEELTR
jgi:hypothetical protein